MYQHYTAVDFILDKDFQQWVRYPSESGDTYWRSIALLYPHQEENMEVARKTLLSLKFKSVPGEAIRSDKILNNILGRIQAYEQYEKMVDIPVKKLPERKALSISWMKIAASIVFILGLIIGYYIWQNQQHQFIKTAYGETKEIKLPDGSVVVLNANSSIRYASDWQDAQHREVWLKGEAYFKVLRLASDKSVTDALFKKFIVHTQGMDIEVLGTEFNVHQRRKKTQVILTEGKVKVKVKRETKTEEVYLIPGELVEYSPEVPNLSKRVVNPENYISWQEYQLFFDGESLTEVGKKLEEIFGYEVRFEDTQIADFKFKGTVPSNDIDVLIEVLRNAYDIRIEKRNQRLIFKK